MNFLDCTIYCICLRESEDRYNSSLKEFKKIGIDDRVTYYRPDRDQRGGRIGCWNSHVACMKFALDSGKQYALIFEDDIKFIENWNQQINTIETFLKQEPDWDIFRIGSTIIYFSEPSISSPNIWQSKSRCMHSYFITRECIQKLLTDPIILYPENHKWHIDDYIAELTNVNDYILLDPICYQKGDFASNNQWGNGNPVSVWGKKILQSRYIYENYQKTKNTIKKNSRFLPTSIQSYMFEITIGLVVLLFIIILTCIILMIARQLNNRQ